MHATLVIGGGVAGLAAAERLARDGHDVLCLDRQRPNLLARQGVAHVAMKLGNIRQQRDCG